jgi:U4/U6 small nuclear ribonucleoprotein PRP3
VISTKNEPILRKCKFGFLKTTNSIQSEIKRESEYQSSERYEAHTTSKTKIIGYPRKIARNSRIASDNNNNIPLYEWWDKRILSDDSKSCTIKYKINEESITTLIEHPKPIEDQKNMTVLISQSFILTMQETRKIRTQRRIQREQEKQELIRQGLIEPNKQRVKLSNLRRILGNEHIENPTHTEREIRKNTAERQRAHDDRNLARKLTPLEFKEKKRKKLFKNEELIHVSIYRITCFKHPQNRYKVEVNAIENQLSGVCLMTDKMALVIVEGCSRSQSRFNKLMTRRINWNPLIPNDSGIKSNETFSDCCLIWCGTVRVPNFDRFRLYRDISEVSAKNLLRNHNVEHYWDLAFESKTSLKIQ